jgi:predicted Zn-ribbon and HTH transcriptional regulator
VVSVAYSKKHYLANKEKYAARGKAWRENNSDRARENRRKYYLANKDKEKEYSTHLNRLNKTGMTKEEYLITFVSQCGKCAICSKEDSKALAADHNHDTKKTRGLLCNSCNRGLGLFKDSPSLLDAASKYLRSFLT